MSVGDMEFGDFMRVYVMCDFSYLKTRRDSILRFCMCYNILLLEFVDKKIIFIKFFYIFLRKDFNFSYVYTDYHLLLLLP